jgi:hypothetical protein
VIIDDSGLEDVTTTLTTNEDCSITNSTTHSDGLSIVTVTYIDGT